MTESIRPLANDIRRAVEDYLDRVDRALAERTADAQQRRLVVEELRAQITEMLTARADAGQTLSAADAQAVLGQLDPPEAYANDPLPSSDADAGPEVPARLPRSAILGAVLVPLPFAIIFLYLAPHSVRTTQPPSSAPPLAFIPWTLVLFAALSPFATTLLGVQAIGEIRRSRGRLYGLALALFDALLFPVLLLDVVISVLCTFIFFAADQANWLSEDSSKACAAIASVILCLAADIWIARKAWHAARP